MRTESSLSSTKELLIGAAGVACVIARGRSMEPTWPNGATLFVRPVDIERLRVGDLVVFRSDDDLFVSHRLIRIDHRLRTFQTKADSSCAADSPQTFPSLLGRVEAFQSGTHIRSVTRGPAAWRQRWIGQRERMHLFLHALAGQLRAAVPSVPVCKSSDKAETLRIWAANLTRRTHLLDAVKMLTAHHIDSVFLKGQALIARGVLEEDARDMGDVDVLIRDEEVPRALDLLAESGWSPLGAAGPLRAHLDDQISLKNSAGVILDLHWNIVTGGWRFRDVIRLDLEGIRARAEPVRLGDAQAAVMCREDQWLHLCLHLMLSGTTGLKWWNDLRVLLDRWAATLDWGAVAQRAEAWRLKTILWLTLDTLWQVWREPVPVSIVRRCRPSAWRRVALRALLPRDLSDNTGESRAHRHLRELLLMDRARDRARLILRWLSPPKRWFVFRKTW